MNPAARHETDWVFTPDDPWNERALKASLGPAHGGLAVDHDGFLYCSTDGDRSVIVFRPDGSLAREFPRELSGIHSLTLVEESGREFLLGSHLLAHRVVKVTLDGSVAWSLDYPAESGCYGRREEFQPTATVAAPDGSIFVADGYGASVIHHFDARQRYVRSFGGAEAGIGQLRNCHGLALDDYGGAYLLLVCDRRNRRLVHFDLNGRFVGILAENLRRPCSVAMTKKVIALAELEGRVSLFDRNFRPIAIVGENPDRSMWADFEIAPDRWKSGVFSAPHSVCFDGDGNLYVQEWNRYGRLTKFVRRN